MNGKEDLSTKYSIESSQENDNMSKVDSVDDHSAEESESLKQNETQNGQKSVDPLNPQESSIDAKDPIGTWFSNFTNNFAHKSPNDAKEADSLNNDKLESDSVRLQISASELSEQKDEDNRADSANQIIPFESIKPSNDNMKQIDSVDYCDEEAEALTQNDTENKVDSADSINDKEDSPDTKKIESTEQNDNISEVDSVDDHAVEEESESLKQKEAQYEQKSIDPLNPQESLNDTKQHGNPVEAELINFDKSQPDEKYDEKNEIMTPDRKQKNGLSRFFRRQNHSASVS